MTLTSVKAFDSLPAEETFRYIILVIDYLCLIVFIQVTNQTNLLEKLIFELNFIICIHVVSTNHSMND